MKNEPLRLTVLYSKSTFYSPETAYDRRYTKMRLFGKSEKKEEIQIKDVVPTTDLETFAGGDKELYDTLYQAIFLDPRKVTFSMAEALENAQTAEKEDKTDRAAEWYEIAGRLAVYEGNAEKVVELFGEAERVSGKKYPILKNTEQAVAKAQEYYKAHLKS
jgi:hypothetical protein